MVDVSDACSSFRQALVEMDRLAARQVVMEQHKGMGGATAVVERVIVPALEMMGEQWEQGELALSQIYMAGRICEDLVDEILPAASPQRRHQPRAAIVTLDDYHFMGKRILYAGLRASGFELMDLGRMTAGELVAVVPQRGIEVLFVSTLMLASALQLNTLVDALGPGRECRIIVGGAPFRLDQELWREVGADAMGTTLADALTFIEGFCGDPM